MLFAPIGAAVVLAAAVLAFALGAGAADTGRMIVLGAPISDTGAFADNGKDVRRGYELAIRRVNAEGGVEIAGSHYKLALKSYDDRSEAISCTEQVEKLIGKDGIKFLLGPFSTDLAHAVEPITNRARVLVVQSSGAGESLYQRGYRYFFGVLSSSRTYFGPLFDMAARQSRARLGKEPDAVTVAVVVHGDRFSRDLRSNVLDNVGRYRMRLVLDDRLPSGAGDLSMTLRKVAAIRPDILIIAGREEGAIAALTQLRRAKLKIPILAVSHCDSARIVERLGSASEGVFCPMQWLRDVPYRDDVFGSAEDFAQAYERAYGEAPTYHAAQSAAAVELYAKTFAKAQSLDPERVRRTMATMRIETFYGPIVFDAAGRNVAKPMLLSQVRGGRHVIIAPDAVKGGEPRIDRAVAR